MSNKNEIIISEPGLPEDSMDYKFSFDNTITIQFESGKTLEVRVLECGIITIIKDGPGDGGIEVSPYAHNHIFVS